jgi:hypothetical protein
MTGSYILPHRSRHRFFQVEEERFGCPWRWKGEGMGISLIMRFVLVKCEAPDGRHL